MLVGKEGGRSICHSKGKGAQDLWNACTYPPGLSTYGSHWPAGGAAGSPPCQSPCNLGRPAGQELESCLSQVLSHSLHMLWSSTQSSSRHCPRLSFVYICFDLCRATLTCACSDLLNGDSLAEVLCHAESDRGVWVQFVGKIAWVSNEVLFEGIIEPFIFFPLHSRRNISFVETPHLGVRASG